MPEESKTNIEQTKKDNPKSGIFKLIRKIILKFFIFLFAFLIIASLSFIFLSQTKTFRSWFYGLVLDAVNKEIDGTIEASDIKISPFEGLQIWDLRIISAGDTLAAIDKITVNYNFAPIFNQYFYVKSIAIVNPRIKLIRSQIDSTWNFEHLLSASEDTSESTKPDWIFDIQNFAVINGNISISDPLSENSEKNVFNPTNVVFENFNLVIQAKADLKNDEYYAEIKKFLVYERKSDLDIREFNTRIKLDTNKLTINNVNLRSNYINAFMNFKADNLNLFNPVDDSTLSNADLTFSFNSEYINLLSLSKFIPNMPEIKEEIKLNLNISGNTDELSLDRLSLKKGNSNLSLFGTTHNFLDSKKLKFNVNIFNSILYDSDFSTVKNAFGLNSININRTEITSITVSGAPDIFTANLNINSTVGDIRGNAKLNIQDIPTYVVNILFRNLNPGVILNDDALLANLNGNMSLDGRGLNPDNITSDLKLNLNKSKFSEFSINSLQLTSKVDSNLKIKIDTLALVLDNTYSDSLIYKLSETSKLFTSGTIDFSNAANPRYNLKLSFNEFNIASLTKFNLAPQYLDASISLEGSGFHPDSIETNLNADIQACVFGNRSLLPFNIELQVERFGERGRQILLNSELFNLELNGEYQLNDFLSLADYQIGELVTFINRKLSSMNYTDSDTLNSLFKHRKSKFTHPYTMDLTAKLNDITPIGIAVGQPNLFGKAEIAIYVDVDEKRSIIDLRKLDVQSFQYKDSYADININPTDITGYIKMNIIDSMPVFSRINLTLNGLTNTYINNTSFDEPNLWFDYQNEELKLKVRTTFNDNLNIATKGKLEFMPGSFKLVLDTTNLSLNKDYTWSSLGPIHINTSPAGIEFEKFVFSRLQSETIELTGIINSTIANDINLEIRNFPLNQLSDFMPSSQKKFAETLTGKLQKLSLNINDSLLAPKIKCTFHTNDIHSGKTYIGVINGQADYSQKMLTGNIHLKDSTGSLEFLRIDVNSLPIDLALTTGGKRIQEGKPIDISAKAFNLPLEIINPFLPDVISNMRGIADAEFKIIGTRDSVDYLGKIITKKAHFLANVNNVHYNVKGNIIINNENITFENLIAENDVADLRNSKAEIDGSLIFRDFNIESFDLSVVSPRIKLLTMKSIKTMPSLYGDFVIASGKRPIKFSGSFAKPSLSGDVVIRRAKLYMPSTESKRQIARSLFKYEVKGNNFKVENITKDSLLNYIFNNVAADTSETEKEDTDENVNKSFADLLEYDLSVRFYTPMEIYMDLGGQLGQIFAIVSTKVPGSEIMYIVKPEENKALMIGDLVLKKNSTLTYIKPFNITGDINFPTGNIDNPRFNFKAVYNGKTTLNNNLRNYTVNLYIRGSKNRPIITFDYLLDNEKAKGDTAKIREDALFLLMFGLTKSEFENPNSGGSSGGINSIGAQSVASVLSRSVTEMLSGTGFISSADIDLQGGSFQNAKLKLSGQLLGMTWNVGGSIADITNGYEFTAEVPLGLLLFQEDFRSLFLAFSTSFNPSQNVSRNQKNWEVKLKFGNEF